jgi:hypothetical protein
MTSPHFEDDISGDLKCPHCHELVNPAAVEAVDGVAGESAQLRCPVCGEIASYAGSLDANDLGIPPQ